MIEGRETFAVAFVDHITGLALTNSDGTPLIADFGIVDQLEVSPAIIGDDLNNNLIGGDEGDYIFGGIGDDTISGLRGDDILEGGTGDDVITGGDGNDSILPGFGDDTVDGGDGLDVLYLPTNASNVDIVRNIDGSVSITDHSGVSLGKDTLRNIEKIIFADMIINIDNAPTNIQLSQTLVAENASAGTIVGALAVTDPDVGDTFTLALDPSVTQFKLDGNKLVVAPGADIDFEDRSSIPVTITATDSTGLSLTKTLTVSVQDVAESFIGTEGPDTIRGDAGNNIVQGLGGNDILSGGRGNDSVDGGAGDDTLNGGPGTDTLHLGAGADMVRGSAADLDGDTIDDFGLGDAIVLANALLARSGFTLSGSGATSRLALSSGGSTLATLGLGGVVASADLMAAHNGLDTIISWQKYLPALAEKMAVASDAIQGIVNPQYLNGDTASSFTVSIESIGQARYANSLGVYEIDAAGNITDVRIVAANVKNAGGPITVSGVDPGHQLGFFLIQDGANKLDGSALGGASLSIVSQGGSLALANNGTVLPNAVTFFSHDAHANVDGAQHVLSGVASDDSGALRIGFEDLLRNVGKSDDDFQDVVITVKADDGAHAAAASQSPASAAVSAFDSLADDLGILDHGAGSGMLHPVLADHMLHDWVLA